MKNTVLFCALGLLVAANCQALTIYDTFNSDPMDSTWINALTGTNDSYMSWGEDENTGGGYLSVGIHRQNVDSGQGIFYRSLGETVIPSATTQVWFEYDIRVSTSGNSANVTNTGIFNSALTNAAVMNTGNNTIPSVKAIGTLGENNAATTATTNSSNNYRLKYHLSFDAVNNQFVMVGQVMGLEDFTGAELNVQTTTLLMTAGSSFVGMDRLGIFGPAKSSKSSWNKFLIDNVYFSTDGPNTSHAKAEFIPEPASMCLLGLGALALRRFKR